MMNPDMDSNPDFYLLKLEQNKILVLKKCTKMSEHVRVGTKQDHKKFSKWFAICVLTLYRCDTGLKHELLILENLPEEEYQRCT